MYKTKVASNNKSKVIFQVNEVVNQKKVINIKNKYVCTRKLYSSISYILIFFQHNDNYLIIITEKYFRVKYTHNLKREKFTYL